MNVDDEEDPYSYTPSDNQQPTMDFQVKGIVHSFEKILGMVSSINRNSYVLERTYSEKNHSARFLWSDNHPIKKQKVPIGQTR